VIGVSSFDTPCLKFIDPYGIPVVVLKAGKIRLATSTAKKKYRKQGRRSKNKKKILPKSRRGPLHGHPGGNGMPAFLYRKCEESNPPTIRILVSKTETF